MIIYKITNKINGKVYIGQTIRSLRERWKEHCSEALRNKTTMVFHNALIKYGAINFTVEQIDTACSREELDEKEIYWIKYYDSMNHEKGYNLTSGGLHCEFGESSLIKIKLSSTGRKHSEETRRKMSESRRGIVFSEEHRRNISLSKKGKAYRLGKHHSEESKARMREIGILNCKTAKKVRCVEENVCFPSAREVYRKLGINYRHISECCNGSRKTAGGFHWEYVE